MHGVGWGGLGDASPGAGNGGRTINGKRHTPLSISQVLEFVRRQRAGTPENGGLDGAVEDCLAQDFPTFFNGAVEKRITMGSICNCVCGVNFDDSMYADAFRRHQELRQ